MDVVFDPVGMIVPSLKCVNFNARILVVGFAGGTIEKVWCGLLLLIRRLPVPDGQVLTPAP